MTWVSTMFQQGGMTMFWIEYLGIAAVVVALLYLVKPMKWARWATIAMIVEVVGAGLYGMHKNQQMVDAAVAEMARESPAHLDEMRAEGDKEAIRPIEFAAIVAGILAVLLTAGEVRRRIAQ